MTFHNFFSPKKGITDFFGGLLLFCEEKMQEEEKGKAAEEKRCLLYGKNKVGSF